MPLAWAIGGSAVLGFLGAKEQAGAAESAANLQYQATQDAARQQREMFNILNEQQKPYREAGYGALNRIQEMLPQFTRMPTTAELQAMPGFQFGLEQGSGAVGQQMNVGSPGSNLDRARQKFATDYFLSQALPAYSAQQTNIYNRLSNLAGIGQTAQQQAQGLGTGAANAISQLGLGGASALGAGQVGAANAMAGGMQGLGNAGMLYQFLRPQTNTMGNVPGAGFGSSLDRTFFGGTTGVAD